MFRAEIWKISEFLSDFFPLFWVVRFSIYLNRWVFVMRSGLLSPYTHIYRITELSMNRCAVEILMRVAPTENVPSWDAQSDQGTRCPLTESIDTTIACINGEQRPRGMRRIWICAFFRMFQDIFFSFNVVQCVMWWFWLIWTFAVYTYIATDKALFSSEKCWYLSYFSMKTYVVGTH